MTEDASGKRVPAGPCLSRPGRGTQGPFDMMIVKLLIAGLAGRGGVAQEQAAADGERGDDEQGQQGAARAVPMPGH